jgi:hypothetical protein
MKAGQNSLWAIFRIPVLLALLSFIGLVSALLADGVWDVVSWCALGIPLILIARFCCKS